MAEKKPLKSWKDLSKKAKVGIIVAGATVLAAGGVTTAVLLKKKHDAAPAEVEEADE